MFLLFKFVFCSVLLFALYKPVKLKNTHFRCLGFKIHPMAYQLQQQAAANFKAPLRSMAYNNGKR